MKYIADLHVHSHYSMATSKYADVEGFYTWANIKGINLVGTGDFTHPGWYNELKEKLVPDDNGFYKLKETPEISDGFNLIKEDCIRFCLSSEISSIYKKNGKTRKVHSLIYSPNLDTVMKINKKLEKIGNIGSDGRPILKLDPKILLEIIKEASPDTYLIPAHIWTPWFSLFGSRSGFDTIEECFEYMTEHIFALETGLSSDPEMNWKWSALDKYTLVSNSDAHSPQKLGREANLFDTEFSYTGMFNALKTKKGFLGTYEFYPQEGKYHYDGHRKCNIVLHPKEVLKMDCICPVCKKQLTLGTLHRIIKLSDRKKAANPSNAVFKHQIPLKEILSEILNVGPNTKTVNNKYSDIISKFINEFNFLFDIPIEEIKPYDSKLSEAVSKMRNGDIAAVPGFDGEFGVIKVFNNQKQLY